MLPREVVSDVESYISKQRFDDEVLSSASRKTGSSSHSIKPHFSLIADDAKDGCFSPMGFHAEYGFLSHEAVPDDIEDILKSKEDSFQKHLFRIIDRKGLEDTEVYKRANLDRRHFSKIRSNENYKPSKSTAAALAIALELNLDETLDLLGRASITLSNSDPFDMIIRYCITNRIYDVIEVNYILDRFGQPLLGA